MSSNKIFRLTTAHHKGKGQKERERKECGGRGKEGRRTKRMGWGKGREGKVDWDQGKMEKIGRARPPIFWPRTATEQNEETELRPVECVYAAPERPNNTICCCEIDRVDALRHINTCRSSAPCLIESYGFKPMLNIFFNGVVFLTRYQCTTIFMLSVRQ